MSAGVQVDIDREGFFGFANVPFHRHLGLRFSRDAPDGPPVVTLPWQPHLAGPGGEVSPSAAYTVAEVASALAASDTLSAAAPKIPDGMIPVMLATKGSFRSHGRAGLGDVVAHARLLDDVGDAVRRVEKARKVRITIVTELTVDGRIIGDSRLNFYIRMMDEPRLQALRAAATAAS